MGLRDGVTLGSIDGLYDGLKVGALVLDDTTTTVFTSRTINAINIFILRQESSIRLLWLFSKLCSIYYESLANCGKIHQ